MEGPDFAGTPAVPVDPLPEWQWIWRAWHRLSAERPHVTQGFSVPMGGTVIEGRPGVIPWSAVQRWAEHHGLTWAEMALLDRVLLAMDGVYVRHWAAQFKAKVS